HEIRPVMTKNPTTQGAFLTKQVSMSQYDITVTKFSINGKKLWSSFLYYGETINKPFDKDGLFISGTVIENNKYLTSLSTNNSYQSVFGGGRSDNYSFTLALDGSKMNYGTFYGGTGNDFGVTLPTSNGFYIVGYTSLNNNSNSLFSTNPSLNQFAYSNNGKKYHGTYISYFKRPTAELNNDNIFNSAIYVYPNPTTDILNIQSKDNLILFTIYDI